MFPKRDYTVHVHGFSFSTKFCGRNEPQAPERIRVLFADSEGDACPDESQEPEVESATPASGVTRPAAPQSDDEP